MVLMRLLILHQKMKIEGKVNYVILFLYLFLSIILLNGCQATNQGNRTITPGQAQAVMKSFYGRITHVEEVQLQRSETAAGSAAWEVLYDVTRFPIGNRQGPTQATLSGTSAGIAAGERVHATLPGWELEIELESGDVVVIVQDQDDTFKVGDHVLVIEDQNGSFRVRQ